ncbi:MAG: aldehyde:ferredoxin oxidoreductase, partial [Desulfobacula sp.]|nr:aldehyde:ferredoxin oxidoreductase [Desulfobacula sp.]
MGQLHLKEIKSISYEHADVKKGYTDQSLRINLDASDIIITPIEEKTKKTFIGGKGYDLWMMWNAVSGNTKWNDPENAICISSGPLGGTPGYPGGGKSIVTSISPLTSAPIDSNVGGYFGPYKKFSGFDVIQVDGKAKKNTIIFIDGIENTITLFESENLPTDAYELSDVLTRHFDTDKPVNVSVVTTGPGAANTYFGCLNFSWWDAGRKRVRYKQAGRGGIGTVFADKKIKAIVARCGTISMKTNNPADFEGLKRVTKTHAKEIHDLDPKQNRMALVGTTHLVPIMNDHDCLPVHNFKFGSHPESRVIGEETYEHLFDKGFDGCWKGCVVACSHGVKDFSPVTGPYRGKKVFVDGPEYETIAGCGANLGIFDAHTILEINFYC